MKRLLVIIPAILILLLISFVLYLKYALPNVGPAPDIKVEATPERLQRGEYLANNVMGCIDCHSLRDFSKYSAPLTGAPYAGGGPEFVEKLGAPGNFYAPNLTPFHLGDWTDGEIYRAITAGVSKDGRALFPSMPSHLYGKSSKEDIYSVIAYLRTLNPVENTVPEPEANFPFSLILNTIPKKAEPHEIPDRSDLVAYGEYVANGAACIECHTPLKKGKYIMEKVYAGGREFVLPTGTVRTSNLTPDPETGIGRWTEETFVNRFKIYADSLYTPTEVGDGFNTQMPWTVYARMDEYDLKAIYTYLHSLKPVKNTVVKFTPK